jgi:N-acyl-D-amino-acid deacylase
MTSSAPAQLVVRGGRVLDGTGGGAVAADVHVDGDRIAAIVEPGTAASGRTVIDATDRVVCPGFIDLHTHCDFSLPTYPRADSMIRQGVTTVVVGNCGFSVAPVPTGERLELYRSYTAFLGKDLTWDWDGLGGYLHELSKQPLALNVAPLVGHGTVRAAVVGYEARPAAEHELDAMRREVADAMDAGAFGLSSGLIYPPGLASPIDELVDLAAVAGRYGGFYATHMRNEGPRIMEALAEAFAVARAANLPLQISHHKILGRSGWGRTRDTLALIAEQRRAGLDIGLDQYPYEASSTNMSALAPGWLLDGGTTAMQQRLANPDVRARARHEVLVGPPSGRTRDFEPDLVTIVAVGGDATSSLVGQTLEEVAAHRNVEPVDALLDLLAEYGGAVEIVLFAIGQDDLIRVMGDPHVAVASDGWTLHPDAGGRPHPRSYGTYARVLGNFVRQQHVLTLEEAVRKMTSLPASRLGLAGELGQITPGARADLVVFDPDQVRDTATYTEPHQFAVGVDHVLVSGRPVIEHGTDTGEPAGQILRRPTRTR